MSSCSQSRLLTLQSTRQLELFDSISNSYENSKFTPGTLIDFYKTFDTVHHSILLNKRYQYGI